MRWQWGRAREQSCPQCGTSAPSDARWCGACGAALRPTAPDEPVEDDPAAARGDGRLARGIAVAIIVAVLGGLLVARATTDAPVVPAGFTSRGDGARTGVVSTTTIPQPDGVAWRSPVDLPPLLTAGTGVLGTTTVDSRELVVVYDPAPDGQRITSHDAATGEVVATTMLPLGSQPYDLSLDAGLLARRDLATVTVVDVATGEHAWRVERRLRGDTRLTPFGVVGTPADADGLVVTLLSRADGSEVWRHDAGRPGRISLVTWSDSTILLNGDDADGLFLLALDPATGDPQWELRGQDYPSQGTFPVVPPAVDDGHVLLAGSGRAVLVDVADGSTSDLPLPPGFAPSVGDLADGLVVLSDANAQVLAIDVTGRPGIRWRTSPPVAPVFAVAIAGDVVAARGDAGTTLLDSGSGAVVAQVGPAGEAPRLTTTLDGAVARLSAEAMLELVDVDGIRWQRPTVATHVPDLATDGGAVAVTTPDGVQVHDVSDGDRRFSHQAFEPGLVTSGALHPAALLAGRVFLTPPATQPADRGGLLSLFADTGIVDWARDEDRVVPRGIPVVDRDLVVLPVGSQLLGFERTTGRRAMVIETTIARADVAAADGWLVATDAPRDNGDLWVGRRSSRDQVFRAPIRTCAPPVIHEDVVIVTDHLGDIVARRLADGEQPWGEKAGGTACRALAIAGDVLVALVDDQELLAVGLDDGETDWRLALPDVAAGAPVVAGDQVLVPTLGGEVIAYDVDGTSAPEGPAWRVAIDAVPAGAVAVDGDTVLVLTREGDLVALR